jgi:hypothetical protein
VLLEQGSACHEADKISLNNICNLPFILCSRRRKPLARGPHIAIATFKVDRHMIWKLANVRRKIFFCYRQPWYKYINTYFHALSKHMGKQWQKILNKEIKRFQRIMLKSCYCVFTIPSLRRHETYNNNIKTTAILIIWNFMKLWMTWNQNC